MQYGLLESIVVLAIDHCSLAAESLEQKTELQAVVESGRCRKAMAERLVREKSSPSQWSHYSTQRGWEWGTFQGCLLQTRTPYWSLWTVVVISRGIVRLSEDLVLCRNNSLQYPLQYCGFVTFRRSRRRGKLERVGAPEVGERSRDFVVLASLTIVIANCQQCDYPRVLLSQK